MECAEKETIMASFSAAGPPGYAMGGPEPVGLSSGSPGAGPTFDHASTDKTLGVLVKTSLRYSVGSQTSSYA